jgi:hypothetical protein
MCCTPPQQAGQLPAAAAAGAAAVRTHCCRSSRWVGPPCACAARECTGGNDAWQLHQQLVPPTPQSPTSTATPGPSTPTAGELHSAAADARGNVWCWGSNSSGQLGTGEPSEREGVTCVAGPLLPVPGCSSQQVVQVGRPGALMLAPMRGLPILSPSSAAAAPPVPPVAAVHPAAVAALVVPPLPLPPPSGRLRRAPHCCAHRRRRPAVLGLG